MSLASAGSVLVESKSVNAAVAAAVAARVVVLLVVVAMEERGADFWEDSKGCRCGLCQGWYAKAGVETRETAAKQPKALRNTIIECFSSQFFLF